MQINLCAKLSCSQQKYKKVAPNTVDASEGFVIPNGEVHAINRFRANGLDSKSYVVLALDYGGENEKIFCSTKGDVDVFLSTDCIQNQISGNGVMSLKIIIINDSSDYTPYIGGAFELVRIS